MATKTTTTARKGKTRMKSNPKPAPAAKKVKKAKNKTIYIVQEKRPYSGTELLGDCILIGVIFALGKALFGGK